MTRVRKLAVGISKWVWRNAPAGAKDWGAASEGELEHIESDWDALHWAVGSSVVLWSGRSLSKPLTSVKQVPTLARGMARIVWRRSAMCAAIVAFEAYWWAHYFAGIQGWTLKTGCCLIVAGLGIFAVQAYLRRWRGLPRGAADAAMISPLREELERQKQFHSGLWLAMRAYALMPGLLLVCCGIWANERTLQNALLGVGVAAAIAVLGLIGTKNQLRTAEGFQRHIDALDALSAMADDGAA